MDIEKFREIYVDEFEEYRDELLRYQSCMYKIRDRFKEIQRIFSLGAYEKDAEFQTENLALHFRNIFELIILANLVTHKKQYTKGFRRLKVNGG
jgi:hypothetical protein